MGKQIPIVDYLAIDDGAPHLVAWEAVDSGAFYFDRRNADAKGGGTEFKRRKLATTGKVRSFTIVNRGVPGVPVPYVSALVDLDGGGTVKANLVEHPARPRARQARHGREDDDVRRPAPTTTAPRRSRSPSSRLLNGAIMRRTQR